MPRGIRSSIAKQFGITKKGWVEERKARGSKSKSKRGSKSTPLAKRSSSRVATYRGSYRRVRGIGIPSIASLLPLAPQMLAMSGMTNIGWDVITPLQQGNFKEAIKRFFTNELVLFTGYDALVPGWNMTPPTLMYGSILASKLLKKYFRGTKIGPLRLA